MEFKDDHFIIKLQESHCFVSVEDHKMSNVEKLAFAIFTYLIVPSKAQEFHLPVSAGLSPVICLFVIVYMLSRV